MQPQPQAKPNIQTQKGAKGFQEYLQDLDALLKKNTGTGLFSAEDATSNTPMYLPGKVATPSGIESNASVISAQPRESVVPDFQMPEYQEEQPQEEQPQDIESQVLGAEAPMTVQDFVNQFTQAVYRPQRPTTEQLHQRFKETGEAYPIMSMRDGRVKYSDGTIRDQNPQEPPIPIATMKDGTVLWSDGFTRQAPPYGMGNQYVGTEGLSNFIFGRKQTVTQPYGNINPIEPTPGNVNYGTDFRTRDLENRNLKLPVDTKVVQILRDDGTRFGSKSGHMGYGNSILLELPTGERVRLSHLSNLPDFQTGETITAGTVFGTPGATGNTYGEHLDVEYYDAQGNISNPSTFLATAGQNYSSGSPITGVSPYLQRSNMSVDPSMMRTSQTETKLPQSQSTPQVSSYSNPQYNMQRTGSSAANGSNYNPDQVLSKFVQKVQQLPQKAGEVLGQTIDKVNPTGEFDLGATEGIITPQAAQTRKETAIKFAQPANRSFLGRFRQSVGNATEQAGDMLGIPDTGISEIIAGGKTRQTNQAFASELDRAAQQNEQPGQSLNIKQGAEDVIKQAGQGIKDLGQSGVDALGAVFRPKQAEPKRAVGDVAGTAEGAKRNQFSSVMDGAPSMSTVVKNDVSDPFFKMGGAEMYKGFLKPNAKDMFGGALNMDIFTPDFYKDLGNITSVFGGSKDLSAATERYVQNEKAKYPSMSRMNWEEGYDRGEIDNYNRQVDEYNNAINNYLNEIRTSVTGAKGVFTPVQTSRQNIFAKPASQMPMSQSSAPRMSAAPAISKPQMSVAPKPTVKPQMSVAPKPAPQMSVAPKASPAPSQNFTPAKANMTSASTGKPAVAPKPAPKPAPAPAPKLAPMSYAKPMSVAPKPAPQQSKAPAPQSKPSSNVFTTVTNAIKKVFRR